jgi:hypothetical protein
MNVFSGTVVQKHTTLYGMLELVFGQLWYAVAV